MAREKKARTTSTKAVSRPTNNRKEPPLRNREQYLTLLNNITTSIITTHDEGELAVNLVKDLRTLLGSDDCYLTRWDEKTGKTIPLGSTAVLDPPYHQMEIPTDEVSMTMSVIREKKELIVADVENSPHISPQIARNFPARSLLGVPLLYGDSVLGVILIAYNTPHTFTQEEIERAGQAGRQIAIAMWSMQQDAELKRRLREQEALARITTTLSQTERVGLSNVLSLIVNSARELIPNAQQAVIHLVENDGNFLIPRAVSGVTQQYDGKSKMRVGKGIAGQVMSDGAAIYLPDIRTDNRFVNFGTHVRYCSLLVAPIISGDGKCGTISVQSETPHAFPESAVNLLTELGQQAAIAIENARLYDAGQQELAERRQAETALLKSEERYRRIAEDLSAMLCRYLSDGTLTFVNAAYNDFFSKDGANLQGQNLLDYIPESIRELVRSRYLNLDRDTPFITYESQEINKRGEKRWLQWTDRIIFDENNNPVEYQSIGVDVTDRKLAEIERERLLQAEREQRLLAETSANATLALVSHTELEQVLNEILVQVMKLLPGCGANIALLEGDKLRTAFWRGYEGRGEEMFRQFTKQTHRYPIDEKVINNPEPYIVADTQKHPLWITSPGLEWVRSNLCIPMLWNEQLLGLLYIDDANPNQFSQETIQKLRPLVNATTAALENTLLIETTRQALKESNALYHINQGLMALDVNDLANDVVELLVREFDYYHVQFFTMDPSSGELTLESASGEVGKKMLESDHRLRPGEGIIGYAAETRSPFLTNDVDEVHFFIRHPMLTETKAEMAIPVLNGKQLLGILDVQQTEAKLLSQRDLQLVTTVADQLAVAMHKAELYENLQTSLKQEKAVRNQLVQNERLAIMGRLLASVSHELNNPLQAIQNALFLLKEEKGISELGRQDLDIVLAESERMAGMIERLRATYRPVHEEDFKPTQVNQLIEDIHALIATHLRKNEIAFVSRPDPSLPYIHALADQIRQVLLNLFMNAVDAMSNGDVLTVETRHLADVNEILIAVSDTGTSISPEIMAEIFEPFITDKKSGTGLGLTISRDIVIKHRGRITAENNPGRGATFRVYLPIDNRELE